MTVDEGELEFEEFDRQSVPYQKRPQATIQGGGSISINASAYRAMAEPKAVALLYDRARRVIGLRPVELTSPNAYPVRPQGAKGTTYLIAGRAFLQYYGIEYGSPRRWDAGIVSATTLVIDLTQPGYDAASNRLRAQRNAAENGNGAHPAVPAEQDAPIQPQTG